jgi:hypothetical protein
MWGMKITVLEESVDFAILDTEKLFSKHKSHELSRKARLNHVASLTSKASITSTHICGHDANPSITVSSILEFALSFLAAASDEQYKSIPNDEIVLLARKFHALHKFRKEKRRSSRGCFECGDTTHFIVDYPRGRSSTPPTSMTIPTKMTTATRVITRRSTTSKIRRRRSFRRSCLERVLP